VKGAAPETAFVMSDLTSRSVHAVRTIVVAVALVAVIWFAGWLSHGLAVSLGAELFVDGAGSAILFVAASTVGLFAFFLLYAGYYAVTG